MLKRWGERLRKLLGIEKPVMQGGMASVSTAKLAAAVSNAGAFGIIAAGRGSVRRLVRQIKLCKALTNKPFGVNFMAINPTNDPHRVEKIIRAIIRTGGVTAVTVGAGVLRPDKIKMLQNAGIKVIAVVADGKSAKFWTDHDADAVIAEGNESGGHVGKRPLKEIYQEILDAVAGRVPVIFAGGIYDAPTTAWAINHGADGVQVGTAFMVAEECEISRAVKQMIVEATGDCTTVTITPKDAGGKPVRVLKNDLSELFAHFEETGFERGKAILGREALERAMKGDIRLGSVMCGKVAAFITAIEPAAAIVDRLYEGVDELLAA